MTIDVDRCTGCSACVVACSIENNVPFVGEAGNMRARQMTWLRHQFIGNDSTVLVMETQYSESLRQDFFAKIRQNLLTGRG